MEFIATPFNSTTVETDCLIVIVANHVNDALLELDSACNGLIATALENDELKNKRSHLTAYAPAGIAAKRLVVINAGKAPSNDSAFRKLATTLCKVLKDLPVKSAAISLDAIEVVNRDKQWMAEQLANQLGQSRYVFDTYKSTKAPAASLETLALQSNSAENDALNAAINKGLALAEGINVARELGDLPANHCTPSYLADRASLLAENCNKLNVDILSETQMAELKMGSLLSVTAGTEIPAKLIVLHYNGGDAKVKPIALVGKGVTFDSGGISLKPGAGMDEMKYDMCGAASVMGTFAALVAMDAEVNVVGIIPAVENMPSGLATKPGDIVTSMSGQTIEVLNTDAEGRLILCDALTYAKRFEPTAIIDIATLTGACVVALGNHATGMFSNDEDLAKSLNNVGEDTGDRVWRLPMWEEYNQQLKSNFADMANIGGRNAGSITAACFLARFTKGQKWAHLDIAGTAWKSGALKGATGRPVNLLTDYLLQQA